MRGAGMSRFAWQNGGMALAAGGLFICAASLALAACSHMPTGDGCDPGFRSCTTTAGTTCVNTSADVNNCGGCGVRCAPGQGCASGMCRGDGGIPRTDMGPYDGG